jgi:hypothetical protein
MAYSELSDLKKPLARALKQVALAGPAAVLFPAWSDSVGPVLAGRSRPVRLHRGVLTVEVSPEFLVPLERERALLIQRLNERLGRGSVSRVFFVARRSLENEHP